MAEPELAPEVSALLQRVRSGLLSDPQAALAHARDACALLEQQADVAPSTRAYVVFHLGNVQTFAGQPRDALVTLQEVLPDAAHDAAVRARIERAMAVAYERLFLLDSAIEWATRAAASARDAGDDLLLSNALEICAIVRSRTGDVAQGLALFEEVLRLREAAGPAPWQEQVLNSIGVNLRLLGRLEESALALRRALGLWSAEQGTDQLAMLRSNLAETLWRLDRPDEAQAEIDATLALATPRVLLVESQTRRIHAEMLRARGDAQAARAELLRALDAAQRDGQVDAEVKAQLSLSELAAEQGDFAAALQHHRDFHAAERRLLNDESARRIQALTVQADLAQARHEAEVYRLRHGELARAHEALLQADREKSQLLEELAAQSRTDPLTGVANRRAFDERIEAELARSRRLGRPLALAMCDLDHFKQINDRFGHAAGDEVLRQVARLLRSACRDIDLVARLGGEEFCLVLVEADAGAAHAACDAARQTVARHDWAALNTALQVTLSIGVAEIDAADAAVPAQLLHRADQRLYAAKRSGRNRVVSIG